LKLCLGTVQFGLGYGAASGGAHVDRSTAEQIVDVAINGGITTFDTAPAYGCSEERLGQCFDAVSVDRNELEIVSKTRPQLRDVDDVSACIWQDAERSLQRLGIGQLAALLVHDVNDLSRSCGRRDQIIVTLEDLRRQGLVKTVGVSAYGADDLLTLERVWEFGAVQVPASILDQRLINDGTIERLKHRGIVVYLRSVFLQGVALLEPDQLPPHLARLGPAVARLSDKQCNGGHASALESCLGYVQNAVNAHFAVVGAHTPAHLKQTVAAWSAAARSIEHTAYRAAAVSDPALLDPRTWDELSRHDRDNREEAKVLSGETT